MTEFADVPLEAVESYWDDRPCNIRHSAAECGTRRYFDEVEARKYLVEPHIPSFAQFEKWKGRKVLEIGCGIGTDTINFARAGAKVTAVDYSAKSLAMACVVVTSVTKPVVGWPFERLEASPSGTVSEI